MPVSLIYNGNFVSAGAAVISASDPAFKWGDGLFETIRVDKGLLRLWDLHYQRLKAGASVLGLEPPDEERLLKDISALCHHNDVVSSARVRLSIFREAGGNTGFVIEAQPVEPLPELLPAAGLTTGFVDDVKRGHDALSPFKTSSYLPYAWAWSKACEKGWGEAILSNHYNRPCDASRANIWMVKNGELLAPPLSEGGIDGVMKRYLLSLLPSLQIPFREVTITREALLKADEIFFTNAIIGLQWAARLDDRVYGNSLAQQIYPRLSTIREGRML